jgi:hypothetical protein
MAGVMLIERRDALNRQTLAVPATRDATADSRNWAAAAK